MTGREWLRRRGNVYAFLGLLVLAGFWMMDGITVYRPSASSTAAPAEPAAKPAGRVFVLLLDSLRYETAISPAMMPSLAALRARAVWARVRPSYNAVTVPCLRAAFTGRDEVSVLGFVRNLLHGDEMIESFFSQFAAAGRHTAAFSDGSFRQFGPAINPSHTTDLAIHSAGVEDYDDQAVARALALFREGGHEIVIVHVRYSDYAGHQYGVGAPDYVRDFQRVDRLVALADAAVPEADTLVVMGDHGHSPDGSHSLGQDVPTLALYRGPRFKQGFALGTIDIMSHRWFFSELFGLPLPAEGYMGGRYPEVFAGTPAVPDKIDLTRPVSRPVPGLLWIYFGTLAVLGAGLLWPERAPWMRTRGAAGWVWLALPAAVLPLPWNAWLGAPLALAILGRLLLGQTWRVWLGAAAAVTVAVGWHWWGRLLAAGRERLETLTAAELALGWLVIGLIVALVATRENRRGLIAAVGLGAGFLALPTNYRYGFTGLMVPLFWVWLVGYAASLVREGRLRTWEALGWAAGSLLLIFGFTQSFAGLQTTHFIFRRFVPVTTLGFIDNPLLAERAVLAKLIIFFPAWPRRWLPVLVKLALIALLFQVQWRHWDPGAAGSALLCAGLFGGWLALRRRDGELSGAFGLALLFFLFAYCVRPVRENYAWADCFFAGLLLATRWLRRFPQPENAAADYTVLGAVAFLATGFFTVSWSIEKLEWSRIYTWFPANWVESGAIVLLPWIAAKTALPLIIARTIMTRELGAQVAWPGDQLRRLAGFKVLTLLLVLTGLGVGGTVSNVYLEGAQQLAVLLMLWFGLAF